jgi:hypothetical protein
MFLWCACCADDVIDVRLVKDVRDCMLDISSMFPSVLLAAVVEAHGEVL